MKKGMAGFWQIMMWGAILLAMYFIGTIVISLFKKILQNGQV